MFFRCFYYFYFTKQNLILCLVLSFLTQFIIGMEESQQGNSSQLGREVSRWIGGKSCVKFDWQNRWLKGHEYAHILKNMDQYCQSFNFEKYEVKSHPMAIYQRPQNGVIYFVKGKGVGSDFGFPRVEMKKKYRWKKMNFTTDLPKRNSQVTYVVASAMRANTIEEGDNAEYRMHAVILYCEGKNSNENNEYILCHVREVDHRREDESHDLARCFQQGLPDFYKLFAYLHNFSISLLKA